MRGLVRSVRRLMMLWGDRSIEVRVDVDDHGMQSVSGVAEGIFKAFSLPWLGVGLESGAASPGGTPSADEGTAPQAGPAADDTPVPTQPLINVASTPHQNG